MTFLGICHHLSFLETPSSVTGFEPDADFAATGILPCGCVICEECRAAPALQTGRAERLELALDDADLRRVILDWKALPEAIRATILILIGGHEP